MITNCLPQLLLLLRLLQVFGCTAGEGPRPMALKRLKQAMATLSSDVRRDIQIFIAAIVFLVVVYFLTWWLG
jgi:hypothetical protein